MSYNQTSNTHLTLALTLPALALVLACTGQNPNAEGNDDESTSADTETLGDGDGEAEADGDGDGDGETDSCNDGQQNGDETDVDCGGDCSPCADGDGCAAASDCLSSNCANASCQAPTCSDSIQNGGEAGIDCGGPCQLCTLGQLDTKLDDLELGDASHPRASMYPDGSFALAYLGPDQSRVRWFDPLAEPSGPSVELDPQLSPAYAAPTPLVAGDPDAQIVHALALGRDAMANDDSLYLVSRSPEAVVLNRQINELGTLAESGALTVKDTLATLTWRADDELLTRRLDLDSGDWVEANPFEPDISGLDSNYNPAMARNQAGISVVAWMRCNNNHLSCSIFMRRFHGVWYGQSAVAIHDLPPYPADLAVAITEDGRVAVVFTLVGLGETSPCMWISGPDLADSGQWVYLQETIPGATEADVLALPDNSFAIAWPDVGQNRVHLRRYLDNATPTLPELDDESPWGTLDTPRSVSLAGVDGRMLVTWSAAVDGVRQIHGQVLTY